MNAKVLSIVGITILALGGVGAYIWWPKDPPSIVKDDDRNKDKDKKDPKDPDNGKPQIEPKPVSYQPAPVSMAAATEFLHTGPNPVQVGMDPKILDARRAAALRGMVFKDEKDPFPSVNVSIQNQPVYGTGYSRPDGTYDMVVNGGGLMTVGYRHEGYLPVWRQTSVPWQDYVWMPPVVMSKVDSKYTSVKSDTTALQTVRASKVKDQDGERQATLLFPAGTKAKMILPGGKSKDLETLNIRATEYTVGKKGPDRMPAPLPANSGYTYCVELSADEALQANAKTVKFEKPVAYYVENFLNFPVGIAVPAGYFDPEKGAWVASQSGKVIKILDIKNGVAEIDIEGKGVAATDKTGLTEMKVNNDELRELAQLYKVGTTLWRVAIPHFSIWDLNWGFSPPSDAVPPKMPPPVNNPPAGKKPPQPPVKLPGVDWKLNQHHDQGKDGKDGAPGRTIHIPVCGKTLPKSVKLIVIEIFIAGRRIEVELPANPDQVYIFIWDGLDVFGRPCQCSTNIRIRIGYVYDGVYEQTAAFGQSGNGAIITGSRTRREVILWQEHELLLEYFDARAFGLGGWSFDVQHAYDPISRTLYLGNGERHTPADSPTGHLRISTVAGGGTNRRGDGGSALLARLDDPDDKGGAGMPPARSQYLGRGLAVAPDGVIYVADGNNRIRRVSTDGVITTIAGGGTKDAATGRATDISLNNPGGLALASDGSLYFVESAYYHHRVRRLSPDGQLSVVAGLANFGATAKKGGFSGDGGPATRAEFNYPAGLTVAPDGTIYVADTGNHCVRRVSPDGIITTIAGLGGKDSNGYSGDGGPAIKAKLYWPHSLALGSDGSLYFSDLGNYVIRRISPSGIITRVAGTFSTFSDNMSKQDGGDVGPALDAKFHDPTGIAVTPDGSLYISDSRNHRIRRVGPDGVIRTFAGVKQKNANGDFSGDNGPATLAKLSQPTALAFGPDGSLYFYDAWYQRTLKPANRTDLQRVRRINPPLPGFTNTQIAVPSPDGKEVFKFNAQGQHLETLDAGNKQVRVRLEYDKAGKLMKIEDVEGKKTVNFERDDKGNLRAVVAPKDIKFTAHLDGRGYLERLTGPDGELMRVSSPKNDVIEKASGPTQKEPASTPSKNGTNGTWRVLNSAVTDDLRAVAFVNEDVGVAVGANYSILRTTDAGKTWNRLMGPKDQGASRFDAIVFADDKVGYIRNQFTTDVYRTIDAGASWTHVKTPDEGDVYAPQGFANHAAFGNRYFWQNSSSSVAGNCLYMYDGATWTKLFRASNSAGSASLAFTSATNAWMTTVWKGPPTRYFVGRSFDGGKSWTNRELKEHLKDTYMLLQAVGKDHAWVTAGLCNFVFATTDGGKTWTPHELGNQHNTRLVTMQFRDAKLGYLLCGDQYHVRQTTDGGKTWTSMGALKAPGDVNGMYFTPAGVGYVVGAGGYIARFHPD